MTIMYNDNKYAAHSLYLTIILVPILSHSRHRSYTHNVTLSCWIRLYWRGHLPACLFRWTFRPSALAINR